MQFLLFSFHFLGYRTIRRFYPIETIYKWKDINIRSWWNPKYIHGTQRFPRFKGSTCTLAFFVSTRCTGFLVHKLGKWETAFGKFEQTNLAKILLVKLKGNFFCHALWTILFLLGKQSLMKSTQGWTFMLWLMKKETI